MFFTALKKLLPSRKILVVDTTGRDAKYAERIKALVEQNGRRVRVDVVNSNVVASDLMFNNKYDTLLTDWKCNRYDYSCKEFLHIADLLDIKNRVVITTISRPLDLPENVTLVRKPISETELKTIIFPQVPLRDKIYSLLITLMIIMLPLRG